jgi:hypothetical protein
VRHFWSAKISWINSLYDIQDSDASSLFCHVIVNGGDLQVRYHRFLVVLS